MRQRPVGEPAATAALNLGNLESLDRLRRDTPLAPVVRDAKAQKLPFLRTSNGALGLVDSKLGKQKGDAAFFSSSDHFFLGLPRERKVHDWRR
jgi:hypothetical protein